MKVHSELLVSKQFFEVEYSIGMIGGNNMAKTIDDETLANIFALM